MNTTLCTLKQQNILLQEGDGDGDGDNDDYEDQDDQDTVDNNNNDNNNKRCIHTTTIKTNFFCQTIFGDFEFFLTFVLLSAPTPREVEWSTECFFFTI